MKKNFFFKLLPLLSSCLIVFLISTINPPQGYGFLIPNVSISCLIYWSLRKDYHYSSLEVFLFGIINDFTFSTPLGSSSVLFLITNLFLILINKRIKFNIHILSFFNIIVSLLFYFCITYLFISIYYNNNPILSNYLMSFILTIFLYLVIYIVLNKVISIKQLDEI